MVALAQPFADRLDVEGNLRDQNRVRAAGDARVERDPARVAAHDLANHDSPMCFGSRMQPIDGISGECDGTIEAEAVRRADDVVVDRLRNTDDRNATEIELMCDGQRAVAANHDEGVQPHLVEHLDDALGVDARTF